MTKAFNDIGHSGDAKKLLKTFKIGEVVDVSYIIIHIYKIKID